MMILLLFQVTIIILLILTIILLIKKKWKASIISVLIIGFIFLTSYFSQNSSLGLKIVLGKKKVSIPFIKNNITVDGRLDESLWSLKKHDLFLLDQWIKRDGTKTTSLAPYFQFLRDSSNIYMAVQFNTGIDTLSYISQDSLCFTLRLKAFNSGMSHFRLCFTPYNTCRESTGYAFCDCSHCRIVTNYNFASMFEKGIWTFEISIPFTELMNKDDSFLLYKFTFVNKLISDEEVSSYPAPNEKYKEFFKI